MQGTAEEAGSHVVVVTVVAVHAVPTGQVLDEVVQTVNSLHDWLVVVSQLTKVALGGQEVDVEVEVHGAKVGVHVDPVLLEVELVVVHGAKVGVHVEDVEVPHATGPLGEHVDVVVDMQLMVGGQEELDELEVVHRPAALGVQVDDVVHGAPLGSMHVDEDEFCAG